MKCIDCVNLANFNGAVIHDAVVILDGQSLCKHHLLRDHYRQTPTAEGRKTMENIEAQL